ncbi:MAG: AzlD domain-containing protein [Aerococcaceae bacterium]|nr:AzlD domain-containing protein [Aerococcaceae bacterium]
MTHTQMLLTILIVALSTMLTRFAPFLLFPSSKKTPAFIQYLGTILPSAVMGLLVVYSFKEVSLTTAPHGLPEAIACLALIIVHLIKRNLLLSIATGTIIYMALSQLIF